MNTKPASAALFDVDGTLITVKGIFGPVIVGDDPQFLSYVARRSGGTAPSTAGPGILAQRLCGAWADQLLARCLSR